MATDVDTFRPAPEVVHICIIAEDRDFANRLKLVLRTAFGDLAQVEGDFDHIPDRKEVEYIMRIVIFDPEMDDFRELPLVLPKGLQDLKGEERELLRLRRNIQRMRDATGKDALYVARTDHWQDANNPLTKRLRTAGIAAGCCREDYAGFCKLVEKLRDGIPPSLITTKSA